MANFWDCVGSDTPKRNWDQLDTISVNEQFESEIKRQCLDHAWPTHGLLLPDPYHSTPGLSSMSQVEDPEVSLRPQNTWDGFQDENPIGKIGVPDIFTPEKLQSQTGLDLDFDEQYSDVFLQIPGAPGVGQFLPTPDSGFNDPDLQTEKSFNSVAGSKGDPFTPQNPHTEPYNVCFGMVSGPSHP